MSLAALSAPALRPAQTPPGGEKSPQAEKAELRKACRMFESLYLQMLWKSMRKTVDKTGLVDGGFGEEIFTDLLDQAVSDRFVERGSMGIADMLEKQLSRRPSRQSGADIQHYLKGVERQAPLTLPVSGRLTSPFGPRRHPVTGRHRRHQGLDLAAPEGTPVHAARAGKVVFSGQRGDYGNLVVVEHADGSSTYYGHCRDLLVSEGDRVTAGQVLATVGSTGLSTGPHLHFELRDAQGRPRDPMPRLAAGLARTS